MTKTTPPVAIIMGSQSDWATMKHAAETLDALGVPHVDRIVSAHRDKFLEITHEVFGLDRLGSRQTATAS